MGWDYSSHQRRGSVWHATVSTRRALEDPGYIRWMEAGEGKGSFPLHMQASALYYRLPARTPRGRRCSVFPLPARSPAFLFPISRFVGGLITLRYRDASFRFQVQGSIIHSASSFVPRQAFRMFFNSIIWHERASRVPSARAPRWDQRRSEG